MATLVPPADYHPLVRAAYDNPLDDTPRQALADYLEERDDPRGPLLRLVPAALAAPALAALVALPWRETYRLRFPFPPPYAAVPDEVRHRFRRWNPARRKGWGKLLAVAMLRDALGGHGGPPPPAPAAAYRVLVAAELYAARVVWHPGVASARWGNAADFSRDDVRAWTGWGVVWGAVDPRPRVRPQTSGPYAYWETRQREHVWRVFGRLAATGHLATHGPPLAAEGVGATLMAAAAEGLTVPFADAAGRFYGHGYVPTDSSSPSSAAAVWYVRERLHALGSAFLAAADARYDHAALSAAEEAAKAHLRVAPADDEEEEVA